MVSIIIQYIKKISIISLFIFLLAFFVRSLVLAFLVIYGGENELVWGDTTRYIAIAQNLQDGYGFVYKGVADAYRAPGYPFFMLIIKLLQLPLWISSMIQITVSSILPVLVYYISLNILNLSKKASFVVGVVLAIEPMQAYFSVVLLPDVFFSTLFFIGLLFLLVWLKKQHIRFVIWAGIFIGMSNYFRPAGAYFAIIVSIFFIIMYKLKKKFTFKIGLHLVFFIFSTFIIMSPWYIRNYIEFGKVGFVSAGTYNLYVYGTTSTLALATDQRYEDVYLTMLDKLKTKAPDLINRWSFNNKSYMNDISRDIIFTNPIDFLKTYFAGLNNFLFSGMYHSLLAKYGIINIPEVISFSFFLNANGVIATLEKIYSLLGTPYVLLALLGKIIWIIFVIGSIIGAWINRKNELATLFLITLFYFIITVISVTIGAEARHRYLLNLMIIPFFIVFLVQFSSRFIKNKSK